MPNELNNLSRSELQWINPVQPLLSELPPALKSHLLDTGSLTARVRQMAGGAARVTLLRQESALPEAEEASCLKIPAGQPALIRDIHLYGSDEQPWVFAHTVIPPGTLSGEGARLGRLGNKPLGEALFSDPGIRRSNLQLTRLLPQHSLYLLAVSASAGLPTEVWGRRSQFHLSSGGSLLVAEFFLPAHPALVGI